MLDSDTKRRINTCRDILVGKVPDPKSQVEQITIALIYKFMDDMDLDSEQLGGERKFFTDEYEQYSWSRLVAPGVGGQEMLNTYSEALVKMVENENLPELFRTIFRNAYLPYRDPETLRSFLREINGFKYDHSERLGDAFEYLLSVLGSQGDAGQFRTPRHIIDFMVEIIDPKKAETIMDPACGTAGFLISSYKHILKSNSTDVAPSTTIDSDTDAAEQALESPLRFSGDLLTAEDRKRLARNIKGYDISPDMVRLSLVNLYLHGFADPQVEEYDTLISEEKWTEMADVILANPPFMSPKGGVPPHRRFQIQSKRSEVLFVDYIAEHLTPQGRAAIIVPEGIIFQSQNAYVALRKMLVDNHLVAVISLPAGVFNPYSGVKTSILILDRALAKQADSIAFLKIENDGFTLGAQRRAVKGGQLAQVKAELSAWFAALRDGQEAALESLLGFTVEKARIAEDADYNLSGEQYREALVQKSDHPYVSLAEFCEIGSGNAAPQGDWYFENGSMPFIRTSDVGKVHLSSKFASANDWVNQQAIEELKLKLYPAKTILFPKSGASTFLNHRVMLSAPAYVSSHLACIVPDDAKVVPEYVYQLLCNIDARQIVPDQAYPSLKISTLGKVEIPLPPLDVQREIVAEIEGYQSIIDGARAVLDNYRPQIPIDTGWPIVEVKEAAAVQSGYGFPLDYQGQQNEEIPFLKVSDMNSDGNEVEIHSWNHSISRKTLGELRAKSFPAGTVIFPKIGAAIATNKKRILSVESTYDNNVMGIVPKPDLLDSAFLHTYLLAFDLSRWASESQPPSMRKTVVEDHKMPLPPLETQQAIVSEINAEQALINANRELITRFEAKIEAAIARAWGAADTEDASVAEGRA